MNKKFCDRCGGEIPTTGNFFKAVHTHIVKLEEIGYKIDNNSYDLCNECAEILEKWLEGENNE